MARLFQPPWPYSDVHSYTTEDGCIVWRCGTGGNMELLHLQVHPDKLRQGIGSRLFKQMLKQLQHSPPYETVFGFTRSSNTNAQAFYGAMGFDLSYVRGVYRDGNAVLFSQRYEKLKELHNV